MRTIKINMNEGMPSYLKNWGNHYKAQGKQWSEVIPMFNQTTGGMMVGVEGEREFSLVFGNDKEYTMFMMRFQ